MMEAATIHQLRPVPAGCPKCEENEEKLVALRNKHEGALLEVRKLKKDKREELYGALEYPLVQCLHACHHAATKANSKTPTRTKKLDAHELECAYTTLHAVGFRTCLAAVVGIAWDPNTGPPRRNGSRETYNQFELAIRNSAKATAAAERVPEGWEPDPEKMAMVTGFPVEQIKEWLGVES